MKTYFVKEMFLTLQGEGARAGSKSLFLRFAGCNLWNGRPEDRDKGKGACSKWCDTDFLGGVRMTVEEVLAQADKLWPGDGERWFVITGGEPLLQLDDAFVSQAKAKGWSIAVETNGTIEPPANIDWVTCSPKKGAELALADYEVDELKVVISADENSWTDEELQHLAYQIQSLHQFVQPQDPILPSMVEVTHLKRGTIGTTAEFQANVNRCTDFVMAHPEWQLSFQMHKVAGLR